MEAFTFGAPLAGLRNSYIFYCRSSLIPITFTSTITAESNVQNRYQCIKPNIVHHGVKGFTAKCSCVVILTIILSSEYLGGDVIGGTAESARRVAWSQALLQKPKDQQFGSVCNTNLLCGIVSLSFPLSSTPHLAHAVVCEFDVSLRVQQHIVQLQISVDYPPLVEVVER